MTDFLLVAWVSALIEVRRFGWMLGLGRRWRPGEKLRLFFAGYNGTRNTGSDVRVQEMLRQIRRIQVRTDRMVTDVMAGGYTSVFRGAGIEFDEVREFTEGDDLRSIDWNVTARTGRPHVKKFMEERELSVLLLLDVSASSDFGTQPAVPASWVRAPVVLSRANTAAALLLNAAT